MWQGAHQRLARGRQFFGGCSSGGKGVQLPPQDADHTLKQLKRVCRHTRGVLRHRQPQQLRSAAPHSMPQQPQAGGARTRSSLCQFRAVLVKGRESLLQQQSGQPQQLALKLPLGPCA